MLVVCVTGLSPLQFIPMPVLYGVFLYMGVASLSGIQVGANVLHGELGSGGTAGLWPPLTSCSLFSSVLGQD